MDNTIIALFKVISVLGIVCLILFALMRSTFNTNKKRWEARNPKNGIPMYYHGLDVTPNKGDFFVRVSEWQWIHLFWDKKKKELIIRRPPDIWDHKENNPIWFEEANWRIVAERQPTRVSVEEYFVRQVM